MKIEIIADDLTGANDTGVQFSRAGMRTSVLMKRNERALSNLDVLVVDTDSRGGLMEESYTKVKEASQYLKSLRFQTIYKKLDSTDERKCWSRVRCCI
ncbi:four-carbon acid sugar kinase family protein [Gracilibacillus sp. YIM 98692]|uniref:four-carbon acid sugar kinase family protein n=1 Tax=Gracilibacillus sp. YIM 98692 TaxID=2663532 RepID=UPI0013D82DC0|nr:four-carbon acid sugar kinase family protein [Gracilibacillus sp. YIM 98692]